jgi:hypothetical protein
MPTSSWRLVERLVPVALGLLLPLAGLCQTGSSQTPADTSEDWEAHVVPYLWFSGLSGDVTIAQRTIPVDLSFRDIFKAADSTIALEGYFDVRKGKWGAFTDVALIKLSKEGIFPDRDLLSISNRLNIVEFGGLYRLGKWESSNGSSHLDFSAGARVSDLKLTTRFTQGEGDGVRREQDWVDPFVGLRNRTYVGKRSSFTVAGTVGGFGAGSKMSWSAYGLYGFRVTRKFQIHGGYRALGQDYENTDSGNPFRWNMVMHGPITGFEFQF